MILVLKIDCVAIHALIFLLLLGYFFYSYQATKGVRLDVYAIYALTVVNNG